MPSSRRSNAATGRSSSSHAKSNTQNQRGSSARSGASTQRVLPPNGSFGRRQTSTTNFEQDTLRTSKPDYINSAGSRIPSSAHRHSLQQPKSTLPELMPMLNTDDMPLTGITNSATQRDLITDPNMPRLKDQPENLNSDTAAALVCDHDTKMSKKSKRALKKKQKAALKQPPERRGESVNGKETEKVLNLGEETVNEETVNGEDAQQSDQPGNSGYPTRIVDKRGQRETRPRQPAARYVLDWVNTFQHCAPDMASLERAERATDIVGVMGTARGRPFQTRLLEYPKPICNTTDSESDLDSTLKAESDHEICFEDAPKNNLVHEVDDDDAFKDDSGSKISFLEALKGDSVCEISCCDAIKDDSNIHTSSRGSVKDDPGYSSSCDGSPKDNSGSETSYDDAHSIDEVDILSCENGPTETALQYMKGVLDRWADFTSHWQPEPTSQLPEAQDDLLDTNQPCQLVEGHFYVDAPRPDLRELEGVWLSAALRKFETERLFKTRTEDIKSNSKEPAELILAEEKAIVSRIMYGDDCDLFATRIENLPPQSASSYSDWDDFYPTTTRLGMLLSQVTVLTAGLPDFNTAFGPFGDLTKGLFDPFAPVDRTGPQDDTQSVASDDSKLANEHESGLQSNVLATSSTSATHVGENTKLNTGEPERELKRKHTPMISRESNCPKKLKSKEVQAFVLREKPA